MIPVLADSDPLPPPERARRRPNGLLAAGGGLSVARLVEAYRQGTFPWYAEGDPVLWWSPDPRMVLPVGQMRVSRSLRRRLARGEFTVTCDTAFAAVIRACAAPRDDEGGTWLAPEMIAAYEALYAAGLAHAVEVHADGTLVGGLYGVALGRMFFGESMFSRRTDASKAALAWLTAQLGRWGFEMIDCQLPTAHLASLGAVQVPRAGFLRDVRRLTALDPVPGPWRFDADLSW
ncbi:MAG: leucyl/phenylalanyl-tRNA--protein transferase [Vicinamibacterales bacterium]|nr:leucyl/phenylalanyl-tRNA--protein transferase [Vicinamibacterales bacterium]